MSSPILIEKRSGEFGRIPSLSRLPPEWTFPVLAGVILWGALIFQLSAQWAVYEQYAYGWVVPFLCLALAWSPWMNRPAPGPPTVIRWPVLFIGLAALLFLPTWIIVEANPIWRAGSYALAAEVIFITLTMVYLAGGWPWVKRFAFPIAFFLVAVPWPSAAEGFIINGLTRLNTAATVELLGWAGIPAFQHGNVIELSLGMVGIDEACSGVRSIQAVLLMTLFFGAFYRLPWRWRAGLVGFGMALAMTCNLGRTFFLARVAARDGVDAIARWHDPAGIVLLLTCFTGIWLTAEYLEKLEKRRKPAGSSAIFAPEGSARANRAPKARRLRLISLGLLGWLLLTFGASEGWFRMHENKARASADWTVQWPTQQSAFREIPIPATVHSQLQSDVGHHYAWREADGSMWQAFYFRWNKADTLLRRATVHLAKTHRPEHCLVSAGKTLLHQSDPRTLELGEVTLPYRALEFDDRGRLLHVFFVAWEEETPAGVFANMRDTSFSRIRAALAGTRGKGQRVMEVAIWGFSDSSQAEGAFKERMKQIIQPVHSGGRSIF